MNEMQRQELVDVLGEYEDVTALQHAIRDNAIEFWLRGKRLLFQIDQNDPDVCASLHQRLIELGAQRRGATPKGAAPPPRAEPQREEPLAESDLPSDPTAPFDAEPEAEPRSRIYSRERGYAIFQSAQVFAVKLTQDLVIEKGNVLVIPLHRPNTFMSLSSEEFDLLFSQVEEAPQQAPSMRRTAAHRPAARRRVEEEDESRFDVEEPAATVEADEGETEFDEDDVSEWRRPGNPSDIIAFLHTRKGAVAPKFIAEQLGRTQKSVDNHLRRLKNDGIAESPQSGFWTLTAKGAALAPQAIQAVREMQAQGRETARPAPASTTRRPVEPTTVTTRSRSGVSPQVGRILAAMMYAAKTTGRTDLTGKQVTPYLADRDAKQYAARMPGMLDRGWVTRGLPIPDGRGWHHRLTNKGIEAIKIVGRWAWEHDGEKVPEWADHVLSPNEQPE